jgi:hypothetical protein
MAGWKAWTGTKEQLQEMTMSEDGFIVKNILGTESPVLKVTDFASDEHVLEYIDNNESTHYLIIEFDSLRHIKIRQAETGQPIWYRSIFSPRESPGTQTCFPNWYMKDVEYSLKPFDVTTSSQE